MSLNWTTSLNPVMKDHGLLLAAVEGLFKIYLDIDSGYFILHELDCDRLTKYESLEATKAKAEKYSRYTPPPVLTWTVYQTVDSAKQGAEEIARRTAAIIASGDQVDLHARSGYTVPLVVWKLNEKSTGVMYETGQSDGLNFQIERESKTRWKLYIFGANVKPAMYPCESIESAKEKAEQFVLEYRAKYSGDYTPEQLRDAQIFPGKYKVGAFYNAEPVYGYQPATTIHDIQARGRGVRQAPKEPVVITDYYPESKPARNEIVLGVTGPGEPLVVGYYHGENDCGGYKLAATKAFLSKEINVDHVERIPATFRVFLMDKI